MAKSSSTEHPASVNQDPFNILQRRYLQSSMKSQGHNKTHAISYRRLQSKLFFSDDSLTRLEVTEDRYMHWKQGSSDKSNQSQTRCWEQQDNRKTDLAPISYKQSQSEIVGSKGRQARHVTLNKTKGCSGKLWSIDTSFTAWFFSLFTCFCIWFLIAWILGLQKMFWNVLSCLGSSAHAPFSFPLYLLRCLFLWMMKVWLNSTSKHADIET